MASRKARVSTSSLSSISRRFSTHEVFNQARLFEDVDLYQSDRALQRCLASMTVNSQGIDGTSHEEHLKLRGISSGTAKMMRLADTAEENKPILRQFDRNGRRIDVIDYHDSYHFLMRDGIEGGVTSYGHTNDWEENGDSHVVRAGLMYMQNQVEPGHCCPLVMTSAVIPVLQAAQDQSNGTRDSTDVSYWLEKLLSGKYDGSNQPMEAKEGVTIGMSMTEKQGGSDVRANTTTAEVSEEGGAGGYTLRGHKWFTSAPMSDGFLTLAKIGGHDAAPSCFIVPRWRPGGSRNAGFQVMRLKNKLADRANASSEVEYHDAYGMLLGKPGHGLQTILQMVQMTRLDCTLGASAGAQRSLQLALNHATTRSAFGLPLAQQPLMQNVLADLCVTQEACLLSAMRMAAAHARSASFSIDGSRDGANGGIDKEHEKHVFRVGVAILKYYCTKIQPQFAYECMEVLGGNGFVDGEGSFGTAKLFRHSPLNSIWEGSGNVMALDVVRAANSLPYFLREMRAMASGITGSLTASMALEVGSGGNDPYLMKYIDLLEKDVRSLLKTTAGGDKAAMTLHLRAGRQLVDRLAIGFQAALLVAHGHSNGCAASAYIATRIRPAVEPMGLAYGANYGASAVLSPEICTSVIEDHLPVFLGGEP